MLETNLDDVTGEVIGHCLNKLLDAGALDVYTTPIQMKRNRPAVKLSVICSEADREKLESLIFRETNTLGIRRWVCQREKLTREMVEVQLADCTIAGKQIKLPDGEITFTPEYKSCAAASEKTGRTVQQLMEEARRAFSERNQ